MNTIFDEFKSDYFPGEDVYCTMDSGEQFEGVIREKAKFPMIRGADGSIQREPFSRYFIKVNGVSYEEALLDDKHIRRDRKIFTKQNLRAFLKNSLQREAWTGAPWLVKEHLAIQYRLPMEIPQHLFQDAKLLQSKQQIMSARPPKKKKSAMSPQELDRMRQEELRHLQMQQQQAAGHPPPPMNHYQQQQLQHQQQMAQAQAQAQAHAQRLEHRPPPPPLIKYPIEDLDLPPKRNGATRPELKFFTEELNMYMRSGRKRPPQTIQMESVGMLLEVWNTLNVQCEVYVLDSFTFDDFADAMDYYDLDEPCELFEELHCAVLKLFMDDKGKLLVKDLPKKKVETPPDNSDSHDESEVATPVADVPARSTRSRLSHMEVAPESPVAENRNRAAEMLVERDWPERLATREFEDGGWQVIVIGILHQLSASPSFKEKCENILAHLAPMDMDPILETAQTQYACMDINLRIQALQLLTILTIRTDVVKDFLEACMDDMTDVRKRKLEYQREKKTASEELAIKDREYKIMLPDNMPASPEAEATEIDGTEDSIEANGTHSSPDPDEDARRSLRRGNDRKRKREEDQARREKEKAEKAEALKAHNKQAKEFKKITKECEDLRDRIRVAEDKIAECDSDLREANVQRTKVLGKDRFCNRYYWFERNGQPFGGLPRSSTASYGYANGRIWVQGPDELERQGFIDRTKEEQDEYRRRFQMSVPERRAKEEGGIALDNAHEWGFIDDPDRLDNLIGWLDDRGEREKKLRKELLEWRDRIVQYMEAYKRFKDDEVAKKIESEEEQTTRVSTRHKVAEDQKDAKARCLKWTNTMAIDENGHLHSRPPKPKKGTAKKIAATDVKGLAVKKPLTRQGEKYSFSK